MENILKSKLKNSEKIISLDLIKNDTLDDEKVAGFISNYAFHKMKSLHEQEFSIRKKTDSLGHRKDNGLKTVLDSINYYSKIIDRCLKIKNSEKKNIIQKMYRITIQDTLTRKKQTFVESYFNRIGKSELLKSSDFFRIESEKH